MTEIVEWMRALVDDQLRVESDGGVVRVTVMVDFGDLVTVSAVEGGDVFTVEKHSLLDKAVKLRDLESVVRSAYRAEDDLGDGCALLCHASDFDTKGWLEIVRTLGPDLVVQVMPDVWRVTNMVAGFGAFVIDRGPDFVVVDVRGGVSSRRLCAQDVAGAVLAAVL